MVVVQWKVIHNAASSELENHLNALAMLDYEIYRIEYIQGNESETGNIPFPPPAPSAPLNVNVYTTPGVLPTSYPTTTFQNPSTGYIASGTMSKTRTRSGVWIIIAYRVEA